MILQMQIIVRCRGEWGSLSKQLIIYQMTNEKFPLNPQEQMEIIGAFITKGSWKWVEHVIMVKQSSNMWVSWRPRLNMISEIGSDEATLQSILGY